jgi:3-phenylpropionate/cinnamic acid dioxygenase small subunit
MMSDVEVEKFLYREARLMDEHQYEEWLSLWTSDAVYWVPCKHDDADPSRDVSIIYDNRSKLGDRVARLQSNTVLAQDPKPRMRRIISNVEIEKTSDTETTAASNFVLVQARGSNQYTWCGRSIHRLRRQDGAIKIAHKKVLLVNSEQEMPVLQFLI